MTIRQKQTAALKAFHGPDAFTGTIRMHPYDYHSERISERLSDCANAGQLRYASIERPGMFFAQADDIKGSPESAMARAVRLFGGEWGAPLEVPATLKHISSRFK